MDIVNRAALVNKAGATVEASEALKGKLVFVYFSGHFCPPCRRFTPKLAAFYKEAKATGKEFEIVFVSSDGSEEEAAKYMEEMHGDWLRIPFDNAAIDELKNTFGCFAGKEQGARPAVKRACGIPSLVLLQDGKDPVGPIDCEEVFEAKESETVSKELMGYL
eukprot:TRINITY_DN101015_c0_g1_i1.p1 TRINITY_DN101015_c0_g1~~TRINITY_DN101015_c0_g1_i1.p1  ORF type:complete len:162 (-),score=52.45 TRINITY_DN101015_c0_g1_i1:133-618(-)